MTKLEDPVSMRQEGERCRKNWLLFVLNDDREALKIPDLKKVKNKFSVGLKFSPQKTSILKFYKKES